MRSHGIDELFYMYHHFYFFYKYWPDDVPVRPTQVANI